MLLGCDTMVALPDTTRSGQTLFAKNSDRPPDECQPLVQRDRVYYSPSSVAECQFVELPQAEVTYRHVGSRPYWCRGYEHGFNEHQVVIGNEALSSVMPVATESKLLGMDLVRLGLERGKTAVEAVQVITAMVTRHGQGVFENDAGVRTYDNGFIVADPEEAYVIETAGHEWAVKRVQGALGISNVHSIGADWAALSRTAPRHAVESGLWEDDGERFDFAAAYSDYSPRSRGRSAQRRARSCAVLAQADGTTDLHTMMGILSDHSDSDDPEAGGDDRLPNAPSICMHYGENTGSNTAASLIADLCADGSRLPVYWCSLYSPCLGLFLPVFVEGRIPSELSVGDAMPADDSPWWLFRDLEKRTRTDEGFNETAVSVLRSVWSGIQEDLIASAYDIASRAREVIDDGRDEAASQMLTDYMRRSTDRVLSIARQLTPQKAPTPA